MKTLILFAVSILFVSCDDIWGNADTHPNEAIVVSTPCDKYNDFYETLQQEVNELKKGKEYNFESPDKAWTKRRHIEGLIDSLNECDCANHKDISFAITAANLLKEDDDKITSEKQNEVIDGTDYNFSGIQIKEYDVIYDADLNPLLRVVINNKTKLIPKSIQVYVLFCDKTNEITAKYDPSCLQLTLIKNKVLPFSSATFTFPLDKFKLENASIKLDVGISKIVRQDGSLVTQTFILN